jgi:hypothetical protein
MYGEGSSIYLFGVFRPASSHAGTLERWQKTPQARGRAAT